MHEEIVQLAHMLRMGAQMVEDIAVATPSEAERLFGFARKAKIIADDMGSVGRRMHREPNDIYTPSVISTPKAARTLFDFIESTRFKNSILKMSQTSRRALELSEVQHADVLSSRLDLLAGDLEDLASEFRALADDIAATE